MTQKTNRQEPKIEVSNLRLTSHRSRTNGVAAWADLTITGRDGTVRHWEGVRLVFDGFWPVDFPIGSYSLYVRGEYRGCQKRGTRLVPPLWRRAAREAVYDAAVAEEERVKQEIADGIRWKPLSLSALRPASAGGTRAW